MPTQCTQTQNIKNKKTIPKASKGEISHKEMIVTMSIDLSSAATKVHKAMK
jgi:hypothetical protein